MKILQISFSIDNLFLWLVCSPAGCQKETLIPVTPKSTSKTPVPYVCFLYKQTRDHCQHWPGTYGGCPYQTYRRHDADPGRHSSFYAEWGIFYNLIKDLWHPRWETGIIGKLYYDIYHSCPSGMLKTQGEHPILSRNGPTLLKGPYIPNISPFR